VVRHVGGSCAQQSSALQNALQSLLRFLRRQRADGCSSCAKRWYPVRSTQTQKILANAQAGDEQKTQNAAAKSSKTRKNTQKNSV
jgi:hypothetical protein